MAHLKLNEKLTTRLALAELRAFEQYAKQNGLNRSEAQRKLINIGLDLENQHLKNTELQILMLSEILMICRVSISNDEAKFKDIQERAASFLKDNL